jgi:hypothetical protein
MKNHVDKYEIVVEVDRTDKENPIIDTKSVKRNGESLNNMNSLEDRPCFSQEGPFSGELGDRCIGFGITYDNRCKWRWGTWW